MDSSSEHMTLYASRATAPSVCVPSLPYDNSFAQELMGLFTLSQVQFGCAFNDAFLKMTVETLQLVSFFSPTAPPGTSFAVTTVNASKLLILRAPITLTDAIHKHVDEYNSRYALLGTRIHVESDSEQELSTGALFFSYVVCAPEFENVCSRLMEVIWLHRHLFTNGIQFKTSSGATRLQLSSISSTDTSSSVVFRSDSRTSTHSVETLVGAGAEQVGFEASELDELDDLDQLEELSCAPNDVADENIAVDNVTEAAIAFGNVTIAESVPEDDDGTVAFTEIAPQEDRALSDFVADDANAKAVEDDISPIDQDTDRHASVRIPAPVTIVTIETSVMPPLMPPQVNMSNDLDFLNSSFPDLLYAESLFLSSPAMSMAEQNVASPAAEVPTVEVPTVEVPTVSEHVQTTAEPTSEMVEATVSEHVALDVVEEPIVKKRGPGRPKRAETQAAAAAVALAETNRPVKSARTCVLAQSLRGAMPPERSSLMIPREQIAEMYKSSLQQRLSVSLPMVEKELYNTIKEEWISAHKCNVLFEEFQEIMQAKVPRWFDMWESIEMFADEPKTITSIGE